MKEIMRRVQALEKRMEQEKPYAILTCADGSTLKVDPCSIMGTMYRRGDIVAIQYSFRDKPAIFDLLIGHCLKSEHKPRNGGTTHE